MMTMLSKWKVALYLLAIFCAGAVSGWVTGAKTAKEKMFTSPRTDEIAASFRQRVHAKLNLTPDQAKRIDTVIDRSSKEFQAIHGDCHMRLIQGIKERNAQVTALLDPEQQKQFEQMEKERQRSLEQMERQRQERWHPTWRDRGPPRDWRRPPQRDRSRNDSNSKDASPPAAPADSKPEK